MRYVDTVDRDIIRIYHIFNTQHWYTVILVIIVIKKLIEEQLEDEVVEKEEVEEVEVEEEWSLDLFKFDGGGIDEDDGGGSIGPVSSSEEESLSSDMFLLKVLVEV